MRKVKIGHDSIVESREPRVMLRQQEKEVDHLEKKLLKAKEEVTSLERRLHEARMAKSATVLNFSKRNQAIRLLNKHDYLVLHQDTSEYWVSCDHPSVDVEDESSKEYILSLIHI